MPFQGELFKVCYSAWSLSLVECEESLKICLYFALACVRGAPTHPEMARRIISAVTEECVATPPTKRDVMEEFVMTHRSICARVGVRLAPETDKEKALSCETTGTVLGLQYNTVTWSWNIDCEKVKCILHMLYDMVESQSVTNGNAMSICGKIVNYAPLFASSKWWK